MNESQTEVRKQETEDAWNGVHGGELANWVNEIQKGGKNSDTEKAWDDVHGGTLPYDKVREAREEEVGFMENRGDLDA